MGPVSKTVEIIVTSHRAAHIALKAVEVRSFYLPVYEGPLPPKMMFEQGGPVRSRLAHARAWADEMAALDAYVFVVNEYCGMCVGRHQEDRPR